MGEKKRKKKIERISSIYVQVSLAATTSLVSLWLGWFVGLFQLSLGEGKRRKEKRKKEEDKKRAITEEKNQKREKNKKKTKNGERKKGSKKIVIKQVCHKLKGGTYTRKKGKRGRKEK